MFVFLSKPYILVIGVHLRVNNCVLPRDLRASNEKVKKTWIFSNEREYIPGRIWNKVLLWLLFVLCTASCSLCEGCIRIYLEMLPSLLWSSPHGAEVGLYPFCWGEFGKDLANGLLICFWSFLMWLWWLMLPSCCWGGDFQKCSVGQSLFLLKTSERLSWV